MESRIRLVIGNLAELRAEALVTAANSALMGGGGVDGAIHRAAGPELAEACRQLDGCPEGEARITPAFRLPARFVIHAVGPIYVNGQQGEAETLTDTYRAALTLAKDNRVQTVAFPCISTGAYRFPHKEACAIAVQIVVEWLKKHDLPQTVVFCCFDAEDIALYMDRLGQEPLTIEQWNQVVV